MVSVYVKCAIKKQKKKIINVKNDLPYLLQPIYIYYMHEFI